MESSDKTSQLLEKAAEFNHLYKYLSDKLLNELGLSQSAINLIELIDDEELTLKEITKKSRLDKSTISRQMNALVKKGFVTKTTGSDKRFVHFTLTDQATEVFASFHSQLEKKLHKILSGWTEEEVQMLTVLLGRLNRSITHRLDQ